MIFETVGLAGAWLLGVASAYLLGRIHGRKTDEQGES